ncbi:PilZ domain-containing protein [Alteromonas aestuariivivens]|uniref:PilZ domain-containing protein n=1 Tax=Alteromonas aestuariivivens TaxID=1938339 RepID=A0A3D8MB22_9ALTE|nr:PilZ domain-containing protein [Alteromonas aestuariivivens]RDV27305.1 PilZ domain-containing protein [Alteromonas aestuariivivens]
MPSYDRNTVVERYRQLIRALIPYEQQNRLLEGLNKFSQRLPKPVRQLIKEEVLRLSSLTDAAADNSAFAQFPVQKFTHFGVKMCLDKIGAQILRQESALYKNRYTIGVFESITNSEVYQAHIKKTQYKSLVDAFAVQANSLSDIDFGEGFSICPNFTLSSREFLNGRSCVVSAFSPMSVTVTTKRPPKVATGTRVMFNLPAAVGLSPEQSTQEYILDRISFNRETGQYETCFELSAQADQTIKHGIEKYIRSCVYSQPLRRDCEIARVIQDLERDRIVENSPWMPIYVATQGRGHRPLMALVTRANRNEYSLSALRAKRNFTQLVQELVRYGEAFYFTGTVKGVSSTFRLAASHRLLIEHGLFSTVLGPLSQAEDFRCLQCRIQSIDAADKEKALSIHGGSKSRDKALMSLSHVVFCKDLTESVRDLAVLQSAPVTSVVSQCLIDEEQWAINEIMEDDLDRRSEARYRLEKEAIIKVGLMKSYPATVADFSVRGMRLLMESAVQIKPHEWIKVSVPDLKIRNEKYQVIEASPDGRMLRLCIADTDAKRNVLEGIVNNNQAYFKLRDMAREQRRIHRVIWELAARTMPSVAVLCVDGRQQLERLKAVYSNDNSDDLYPYVRVGELVPLHGFLADRSTDKPRSGILKNMFRGAVNSMLVIHCVRKADKRLVYLSQDDFMHGSIRQPIRNHLAQGKTDLAVTRMHIQKCTPPNSSLVKKRLAQLSKIDKAQCELLANLLHRYTHVLYLTNESSLHIELVRANLCHNQNVDLITRDSA